MANIFQEIATFLKDGAADIAKGVAWIGKVATNLTKVFEAGVKVEPATVAAVVTVVGDVESLATLAAGAAGATGLNFPADSAVYQAFEKLLTDLKTLGSQLKTDVEQLEQAAGIKPAAPTS